MNFLLEFKRILNLVFILGTLGLFTYLYIFVNNLSNSNKTLQAQLQVRTYQIQQLSTSLERISQSINTQTLELNNLNARTVKIREEAAKAQEIFQKHDLTKLSAAKPNLIQIRVNRATQQVFDTIEAETQQFQTELLK
jgi:regulator of replication initiation timing